MNRAFEPIDPESDFLKYCLPIIGIANGKRAVCGTGVKIAPNLMITAFHNITGLGSMLCSDVKFLESQMGSINLEDLSIITMQPVSNKPEQEILWGIRGIYRSEFVTDLALLFLEPVSNVDEDWHQSHMAISFDIPKIGDEVAAFGFPEAEIIEMGKELTLKSAAVLAPGHITALNEARPVGQRTFPTLEVETIWPGGMSGGPIFFQGGVIGFVTTGYAYLRSDEGMKPPPLAEWPKPEERPVSMGAMLWPLFGDRIRIPYINDGKEFGLSNLARKDMGFEKYWIDDVSNIGGKILLHRDDSGAIDQVRIKFFDDNGENYKVCKKYTPEPSQQDILLGR